MVSDFKLAVALVCVVLFNSTLLGIITYKGAEYRSTIRSRTEGLRVVGAVLSGLAPKEPLAKQLGSLLAAVSGEFVFGSFNGTLPAFLQNALATNFAGIATQVSAWSSQVISTFGNVSCATVLCDHANQVVQCAGRTQYCGAKGEYVNCQAEAGCIPAYVTTLAAAVKSVADKIARLSPIQVPSTTPPAFSNGIFRLDVLFSWFASQFDFVSWRAAGQVASNFVANVRHVDFSGCARDRRDRRERCYDINPAVTTILDTINQVSFVLAPPTVAPTVPSTPAPPTMAPQTMGPQTPSPGTTPTTTPIPTAAPVPTQVPQVFSLTVATGVSVSEAIANIAAALNVSSSAIQIEATTSTTVQFSFSSPNAAGLSEQLNALAATPQGRAELGISSLHSAPLSNGGNNDSNSGGHDVVVIGVGAGVGGVVVGTVIGAIVYNAVKKPPTNENPLLEMQSPHVNTL